MRYLPKSKDFIRDDPRVYRAKPEMKNEKIKRVCLFDGCGKKFTAENRFLRLCDYHRSAS